MKNKRRFDVNLKCDLETTTTYLKFCHFNEEIQKYLAHVKHRLLMVEHYDAQGAQIKDKWCWLKIEEKVTKELFSMPPTQESILWY